MKSISVAEARAIDRDAVERLGMPSILLMENAARSVAELARQMGDSFVVYCGPGNNGGDGLAAARHLGRRARVFLTREPDPGCSPDAVVQLTILRRAGHPVSVGELPPLGLPEDVLIDALFGTGLTRALSGDVANFVERFNESPGKKLCVDIPSGLHGDDGVALGPTCRGDKTVTFAAAKHGLLVPGAKDYVGELVVVGLGLPDN
jgi:NAD(P)H-hydrate epimerase